MQRTEMIFNTLQYNDTERHPLAPIGIHARGNNLGDFAEMRGR